MIGTTVTNKEITGWFNNQGYHTAPLSLNVIYNTLLQTVCPACRINVWNKPLPYKPESKVKEY